MAFGWRWCFFGSAILCSLACLILFILLRDTPTSVRLPEIEAEGSKERGHEDRTPAGCKQFVKQQAFLNPHIWYSSLANFFVYILRFAVLDWGPTLLKEMKHFAVQIDGGMVGAFEVSGILGRLLAGWATDRFFRGGGACVRVFCMIGACAAVRPFWQMGNTPRIATVFLALIGITADDLATKQAAATAAGFTGDAGTLVSGVGLGFVVDHYGWNTGFGLLLAIGAVGTFMFILAWPGKVHGYNGASS